MDLIRKQPLFYLSLSSMVVLAVFIGVAVARLNSWELARAQEDAAIGSFACEPLVFTLSASDEAGTGGATASPTSTARPTATSSASPRASASASPTATAAAKGGVSPTPSATATGTATAKPTSTAKGGELPDAGISTPTIVGIAAGFLLLLAAALFAL